MRESPEFEEFWREPLKPVEQQAKDPISAFIKAESRFRYGNDLHQYDYALNYNNRAALDKYIEILTEPADKLVTAIAALLLEVNDSQVLADVNDTTVKMAGMVLEKFTHKSPSSFWRLVARRMGMMARENKQK